MAVKFQSAKKPTPLAKLLRRAVEAEGDELRQLWKTRLSAQPPRGRSEEIIRLLFCWKVQAGANGGLDESTRDKIAEIRRAITKGQSLSPAMSLRAGMVLIRWWYGTEHRVTVLENGFEYKGQRHRTLSDISHRIAGPKYSGPHFFGVSVKGPYAHAGRVT